jgi:hypothetical protein
MMAAGYARAMEHEGDSIVRPLFQLVRAVVPEFDTACSVFALRDSSLELFKFQVMIFYLNRPGSGSERKWDLNPGRTK